MERVRRRQRRKAGERDCRGNGGQRESSCGVEKGKETGEKERAKRESKDRRGKAGKRGMRGEERLKETSEEKRGKRQERT